MTDFDSPLSPDALHPGNDDDSVTILHVDDEPDFAEMAAAFLGRNADQFTIETATNAADGLDRLATSSIDCIVSDYEMPTIDGLTFLERVREDHPDLPFILFTGKGSEEIASEAIAAGVTDYLQKEQGTDQFVVLANRIQNAVAQYRTEQHATAQDRILSLTRSINQALVRSSTRSEIATAVCDIFAGAEPYTLAWFGEYDADWDRIVPETVAGTIDPELVTPVSTGGISTDGGAIVDAIRTHDITIAQRDDATLHVWTERGPHEDYESVAILPTVYQGERYGLLALYADSVDAFGAAEQAMLAEIAADTAQALHAADVRQTLTRHKTAVEAVPEGVFILDEDATIVLVNESAATLFNRSRDAVVGEPFPTFIEEGLFDDAIIDWYLESVRGMLSSATDQDAARYETVVQLPSGETQPFEVHLTLRPYDEDFRGTVGIVRDTSEQKQREQELQENKERYRQLVENAPVPIGLYDADGRLVYVNDAGVAFVGAETRESVLGRPACDFVHQEDEDRAAERMRRVIAEREPTPAIELTLVDLDGNRKPAITNSVPVTYENEPAGQIVLKDISIQKEREQALERQRDRLDEFASVVSHDLRNPLNVAVGNLELAQEACDSTHLDTVAQAHDRMEALIEDLLTLARSETSATPLEPVDLATISEECWQTVSTAGATLETDTSTRIEVHASRLRQLLENLFRNAIEHGGPAVTITIGDLDDGFYVEDDGPGIPAARHETVFEMGHTSTDGGTGFGLSIVKEIAAAHGWDVTITDGPRGGARFEITGIHEEFEP